MVGYIHEDAYPRVRKWAESNMKDILGFKLKTMGITEIVVMRDSLWPKDWDKAYIYPIDDLALMEEDR